MKMWKLWSWGFGVFWLTGGALGWSANPPAPAQELVIRHIGPEAPGDQRPLYFVELLRLALQKTEAHSGPFRLEELPGVIPQGRALLLLERQEWLNVVWTMTSREREKKLLPIRIPLLKGLLGHRIFLIRAKDSPKFAKIHTLAQLQSLRAGQGHDWPDTEILQANGLTVVTSPTYEGLFKMLELGRIDYFPRGVNEPWEELAAHAGKGLAIEKRLMLQYPTAVYFFVHPSQKALAERLERGLRQALADGSFELHFRQHPLQRPIFEQAQMAQRRVLRLENPLLPPETPLKDSALWYNSQAR